MARLRVAITIMSMFAIPTAFGAETPDADIAQTLVQASIAIYDGTCACPYHLNSKRQECAGNSAYKRGNNGLLCYRSDVTPAMISRYKSRVPARAKP